MLSPREDLDIVEIIFYAPVLVIALLVCIKHGFGRSSGYLFFVFLALLRLIGASTGIAAAHYPTNTNLVVCSLVCSQIGLSPLMLAVLGYQNRVVDNARPTSPIPHNILRLCGLPIIAALIVSIVASTSVNSISDFADGGSYHRDARISAGLYIASWVLITGVVLVLYVGRNRVAAEDMKLLHAGMASLPFIFVRMLYTVLLSFDYHDTSTFSLITDTPKAVAVQGCMTFAMEVFVVIIMLTAAILTPRNIARQNEQQGQDTSMEQWHVKPTMV